MLRRFLGTLLILLAAGAPAAAGDWPMWKYDVARSGASPHALPEQLHLEWVLRLPPPQPAWPTDQEKLAFDRSYEPIVAGGLLIVPSMRSDSVTAYHTQSGEIAWRFYADGPVRLACAAWKDRVYFVSDDGHLYCLNLIDGSLLWRVRGGPSDRLVLGNERMISAWPARGGVVVADDRVYFAASIWPFMGTFIHCVDASSGKEIWTNSGSGANYLTQQHGSPAFAGAAPQGYLAVAGDKLIVSGGRTTPAVYQRSDGRFLYFDPSSRVTGKDPGGYAVTVLGESYLNGGYCYRLADGKLIGRATGDVVASNHRLLGLDRDDLHVRTVSAMPSATRPADPLAILSKPQEIAGENEVVVDLPDDVQRLHLAAGERVYASGENGVIYAFNIPHNEGDAKVVWQGQVRGRIQSMIAGDNRLFVVTREGWIYCFGEKAGETVLPSEEEAAAIDEDGIRHLVKRTTLWKYQTQAGPPGDEWTRVHFDDTRWAAAPIALDDDDDHSHKLLAGALQPAPVQRGTYLYRRTVTVNPRTFPANFRLRITGSEGTTVWLNGHKLVSLEIPKNSTSKAPRKLTSWEREMEGGVVVPGPNVLAISVPNLPADDFDEGFLLEFVSERTPQAEMMAAAEPDWKTAAGQLVRHSKVREGYALIVGVDDGRLIEELARHTRLNIVGLDPDREKIARLRRSFDEAGLYGRRVSLLPGDLAGAALPPYFASLVVALSPEMLHLDAGDESLAAVHRILRPYGGVACFQIDEPAQHRLEARLAAAHLAGLEGRREGEFAVFRRPGGLTGAGVWTSQNGDAGNTLVSRDELVKLPLGLLWFGGPTNAKILPRHGHGPTPQVIDGRLLIEGPDLLRATDVYTGRLLWERKLPGLGLYYDNTGHHPGAAAIGGNYVSTHEAIYVAYGRKGLRLDPASGEITAEYQLPPDPSARTPNEPPYWGYLGVVDHLLVVGSRPLAPLTASRWKDTVKTGDDRFAEASSRLAVLDRASGGVLWNRDATFEFRHNAIVAGTSGGKTRLFVLDRTTTQRAKLPNDRSAPEAALPALLALDAQTGQVLWQTSENLSGTWLGYSAEHDVLVQAGAANRDRPADESKAGLVAYRGATGEVLWSTDALYSGPCLIHGRDLLTQEAAFDLLKGEKKTRTNPLTDQPQPWTWTRNYGCNTAVGCTNLLTFRSAAAGFLDLSQDGGTGNFGGFRSGCTNNLIPADGVLSAPDYTRTCTCSYQNQTSLALVHMPELEYWTFNAYAWTGAPVRRLGINFGAPGDRRAADGTLWLEWPSVAGKSPDVPIRVQFSKTASPPSPAAPQPAPPPASAAPGAASSTSAASPAAPGESPPAALPLASSGPNPAAPPIAATSAPPPTATFRHHSSAQVADPLAWIGASGLVGASEIEITLAAGEGVTPRKYLVRLYFSEPAETAPGQRRFDVQLQGKEVLHDFDVAAQAQGPRRTVVKEFTGILVEKQLRIALQKSGDASLPAILSGVEVRADGW